MSGMLPAVERVGREAAGPVYVYDLDKLRERCALLEALPIVRKQVFFATMANDHPSILSCIRDCGLGVFVNSSRHLRLVRELGFEPELITYAASNMRPEEMRSCLEQRVNLVLDSLGQIRTLAGIAAPGTRIGVRLNVGSALTRDELRPDPSYRFGLLEEELPAAVDMARRAGVKLIGAHSYFGTGLMHPELLLKGLERLGCVARALPDLTYLDVGGGFGIPDALDGPEFDIAGYAQRANTLMRRYEQQLGRDIQLYLEPGRYLAAGCGYFFVKVVDCKVRPDRVFVGTNGSVAIFPRPLMYPEQALHPCVLLGERGQQSVHSQPLFICGNSTYSQDFLARNLSLPLPSEGDTLVFHNAGAYGRSMLSRFLGQEQPEELFIGLSKPVALAAAV